MRHAWILGCVLAACAPPAPVEPAHAALAVQITMTPPPPPPADDGAAKQRDATRILRAYADEHALGAERRAPTEAELAAAAAATDPPDPETDPVRWHGLDAKFRLLEVYMQEQHRAWVAACNAGVEAWWHSARGMDDELVARLAQAPVPAEFYAGMGAWTAQRDWLVQRKAGDAVFGSLPALASVGATARLVAAENAWAQGFLARGATVEAALAQQQAAPNTWALEELPAEQARYCAAAYTPGLRTWPPPRVKTILPMGAPVARPQVESGTVARVSKEGRDWRVARRDWTTTLEPVPPCKRVRCTGRDCNMVAGGGWHDACAQKELRRFSDHVWELHLDAPPVTPHVGDLVTFSFDPATGHAVVTNAARNANTAPYFELRLF